MPYNIGTGGVDKYDFPISIYRTYIRSQKWTRRTFTHGTDTAVTNSWLVYVRNAQSLGLTDKKTLDCFIFDNVLQNRSLWHSEEERQTFK